MTRLLFLIAVLIGGAIAVRRLLPAERREGLSRLPGTLMERCMEHMPEDSPPKVMMSSLHRIREQNEEILALLRARLPADKGSSEAEPQAQDSGDAPSD